MLSSMSEEDYKLIDAISGSNDLDIFSTDIIMDLVDFKWERFGKKVHKFGFANHVIDIMISSIYIRI